MQGLLFLASALVLISAGQLVVLLTGGLDLSVGPLAGLVAVILSLSLHEGSGPARYALALGVAFACAFAVGLANYVLAFVIRLGPVLATASMLIVLPGVSLLLRTSPGGSIDSGFIAALRTNVGSVPVIFVAAVIVCVAAEIVLRCTHLGIGLRAVGSDAALAHRLGAHVAVTRCAAYVLCALFAFLGGLLLAAQIGIGDPSAGGSYSLTSIAAVVLGGASIYGGRGSFIGALLGALLIQESATSTAFSASASNGSTGFRER